MTDLGSGLDASHGEDPQDNPTEPTDHGVADVQDTLTEPGKRRTEQEELRYSKMLTLVESGGSAQRTSSQPGASKLILGTNPLSELLRKDIKDKVITNGCSFRTPDPAPNIQPPHGSWTDTHPMDWEQQYCKRAISKPRLRYLRDLECSTIPDPARNFYLLEVLFSRVHPILPVINRNDFMAHCYGASNPPPSLGPIASCIYGCFALCRGLQALS